VPGIPAKGAELGGVDNDGAKMWVFAGMQNRVANYGDGGLNEDLRRFTGFSFRQNNGLKH